MHEQKTEISACLTVLFAFSTLTVYARYGLGFVWPTTPYTIEWYCYLNSQEINAVEAGMDVWNAVRDTDGSELLTSVIIDYPDTDNQIFYGLLSNGVVASTEKTLDENGYIESMRIILSTDGSFAFGAASGAYDFQSVVMHELGHSYGIAHCHEEQNVIACEIYYCPYNVMTRTLFKNSTRRVLQAYDLNNYRFLY